MTLENKDIILEKLEILGQIITGNGDPEKGLIVMSVRMDQKLDAVLEKLDTHMGNKEIHRTELDTQNKMIKIAAWLLPLLTAGTVAIHVTLTGQWVKLGELVTKWLGLPGG